MNPRIVAGHAFAAGLFITAWQVAIAAPAGPADTALVLAGIAGPPVVAGISLGLIAAGDRTRSSGTTGRPVPAPRRPAVTASRNELAR